MIKNLIFSGGGFRGWAYIGTIKALNELINIKDIEVVIGTSIGSIFGLFYILGIKWEVLLEFIINLNFKDVIDIDIDNILVNQSLMTGIKFSELIKEIISIKVNPEITFIQLYRYSKILYIVNALNINNSKVEYFNYLLTPNVKVIDAVRASSGLPFLFPPYKIGEFYYYDGGLCNNCPTNLVDELNSLAFGLGSITGSCCTNNNDIKLIDLIISLVNISNKGNNINSNIVYQILDHRFKNETVNLHQSKDDIFNIYMNGYINSKNIIYNNFIALPPPPPLSPLNPIVLKEE